jgi:proteasome lid subunit RPN8/RPN11
MAYQNETQQGSSKLNFYGTDLTYNKTDSDTMTVHWHPRCGLCSSSEDIRFSGENMSWNAFSAKD